MSCYLRHLKGILEQAGVKPADKKERQAVDRAVKEIVGMESAPCNEAWKTIKQWLAEPGKEQLLISELQKKMNG